jgi:SP family facilitated glucose transporter-like MFS transporter 1
MVYGSPGKLLRSPYRLDHGEALDHPIALGFESNDTPHIQLESTVASPLGEITQRVNNDNNRVPVGKTPKATNNNDVEEGSGSLVAMERLREKDGDVEPTTYLLWFTVFIVAMGSSFQFGYGTGVMNNTENIIRGEFMSNGKSFTTMQWAVVVSSYGIGGLLGSLGVPLVQRTVGRRDILLANNVFVFASSALIAFAPSWWVITIGRVCIGIVAGVSTAVVPTYFAEICPTTCRGAVGTLHQLGIVVGILISQLLSTPSLHLLGSEEGWRWLFLVPAACAAIQMITLPFCPESPSFLYQHKGAEAARTALERFLGRGAHCDRYLDNIRSELQSGSGESSSGESSSGASPDAFGLSHLFSSMQLRRQLIVGVVIQLSMQFSGIDAVLYYSTSVFQRACVPNPGRWLVARVE